MDVLLVGGGGRENAIAWKLSQSPLVNRIYCAPGNPGIAQFASCVDISSTDIRHLRQFVEETGIDLTVVGPEATLVAGIVDEFEAHGLAIFGPSSAAAMIEGSKVFAKEFMRRHHIPTADFQVFNNHAEARQYVETCPIPIVVKADGLAAGKGAIVAHSRDQAADAVDAMLERRQFGEAGSRIVIEEFLEGEEASVFCLTDGTHLCVLPSAQDHKPIYDGDQGPNTGGMGAYAPAPVVTGEMMQQITDRILRPAVAGMKQEGRTYRGVLYGGLMITAAGPKVVEFNCRFGDPEAQVVLPLLESDLAAALWLAAHGHLQEYEHQSSRQWALTVVMTSAGYPGKYDKGKVITGIEQLDNDNVLLFHAGTAVTPQGELVTNGGRVIAITGVGETFHQAQSRAYEAVSKIHFEGEYHRSDIGSKALPHLQLHEDRT